MLGFAGWQCQYAGESSAAGESSDASLNGGKKDLPKMATTFLGGGLNSFISYAPAVVDFTYAQGTASKPQIALSL